MRVGASVFSEANSRILTRLRRRNHDFVLNYMMRRATHIYGVAK